VLHGLMVFAGLCLCVSIEDIGRARPVSISRTPQTSRDRYVLVIRNRTRCAQPFALPARHGEREIVALLRSFQPNSGAMIKFPSRQPWRPPPLRPPRVCAR
jgi:hypothetical protein